MINSALFASRSEAWGTPLNLFRLLDQVFAFQLDAAASDSNALCSAFFTAREDGLNQDWYPYRRIWLNPPYGRQIAAWLQKAYTESQKGCLVVCLVPARVDTRWWHDWVKDKADVTFLKGRLKYRHCENGRVPGANSAPFPSSLLLYLPDLQTRFAFSDQPDRPDRLGAGSGLDPANL